MRLRIGRDIPLRITALLLAIVVWFVAGADIRKAQSDTVEKIVVAALEVRGVASDLVVTAKPRDVEVRVRGPRRLVEPLDTSSVRAFASVAGRGEGEHGVSVQAWVPEGVQVVEVLPAAISVTVDAVVTEDVPVTVALVGFPAEGRVPLEPRATPRSVRVAGPKTKVRGLKAVVAYVDVSGAQSEVSSDVSLVPVDTGGSPVEGVSVYPSSARVIVAVGPAPQADLATPAASVGTPAASAPEQEAGRATAQDAAQRAADRAAGR